MTVPERPWSQLTGRERAHRVAWGVVPIAFLVGALGLLFVIESAEHLGSLPEGYAQLDQGDLEIYYPRDRAKQANAVAADASRFIAELPVGYGALLGSVARPPGPLRITLFRNHDELVTFAADELQADFSNNGGYCSTATQEIEAVLDELVGHEGRAIRHELAHLLLGRGGGQIGTRIPPWLEEGLAVWFETAPPASAALPGPLSAMTAVLAARAPRTPTLGEIVDFRTANFRSAGNSRTYAFASLLVRFLVADAGDRFWHYVRMLRLESADPGWRRFAEHFEVTEATEARWQRFVTASRPAGFR